MKNQTVTAPASLEIAKCTITAGSVIADNHGHEMTIIKVCPKTVKYTSTAGKTISASHEDFKIVFSHFYLVAPVAVVVPAVEVLADPAAESLAEAGRVAEVLRASARCPKCTAEEFCTYHTLQRWPQYKTEANASLPNPLAGESFAEIQVVTETPACAYSTPATQPASYSTGGVVNTINGEDAGKFLRANGTKVAAFIDGQEYGATYGGEMRGVFAYNNEVYRVHYTTVESLTAAAPAPAVAAPDYVAPELAQDGDVVHGPAELWKIVHGNFVAGAGTLTAFLSPAALQRYLRGDLDLGKCQLVKITVSEYEVGALPGTANFWASDVSSVEHLAYSPEALAYLAAPYAEATPTPDAAQQAAEDEAGRAETAAEVITIALSFGASVEEIEAKTKVVREALTAKQTVLLKADGEADAVVKTAFVNYNGGPKMSVYLAGHKGAVLVYHWDRLEITLSGAYLYTVKALTLAQQKLQEAEEKTAAAIERVSATAFASELHRGAANHMITVMQKELGYMRSRIAQLQADAEAFTKKK